mgnify:CR=1 FL=1
MTCVVFWKHYNISTYSLQNFLVGFAVCLCNNKVDTKNMIDVKTSDKYILEDFFLDGQPLSFDQAAKVTQQDLDPKQEFK